MLSISKTNPSCSSQGICPPSKRTVTKLHKQAQYKTIQPPTAIPSLSTTPVKMSAYKVTKTLLMTNARKSAKESMKNRANSSPK